MSYPLNHAGWPGMAGRPRVQDCQPLVRLLVGRIAVGPADSATAEVRMMAEKGYVAELWQFADGTAKLSEQLLGLN